MEGFSERFGKLISDLGIRKSAVADRLNVTQPFISQLCSGVKNPSDRTISDICREFDVREEWLRTGEGEMYIERTRRQVIADFLADVLKDDDSFRQKIIEALAQLDQRDWEHLETIAKKLTKKEE